MKKTENNVTFHVWNEGQCKKVVEAALKVLETTGCRVKNEEARKLMLAAGCGVDGDMVKIPADVMGRAIESAPSSFVIYDQNGNPAMEMDSEHSYFGPPISTVFIRDPFTGEKRRGVRQDAYNAGLVCQALPNCDWASAMSGVSDGVSALADVYEVYGLLKSTTKPIMYWAGSPENLKTEFKMFEAVAGGAEKLRDKPSSICLVCPMDPLVHNDDSLEQLIYLARRNAVAVYISGVSLGCTSPITIAGSVAVGLADTLVGLLVSQLACKGAPFIVSRFCDNMDMRNMTIQRSHPEMVLANMASCDVFRYLNLPFAVNLGDTDSGIFDQTAAFDQAMSLYSGTLGFATMNMSMGGFESANVTDYVGTAYGSEIVNYIQCLVNGAEVSDAALALEDIDEVGPGGNFLMMEDTFEMFREFWQPGVLAARTLEQSCNEDYRTVEELYREKIRQIISDGPSSPLASETAAVLDRILDEAEKTVH